MENQQLAPQSRSEFFDRKTKDTLIWYTVGSLIPFFIERVALAVWGGFIFGSFFYGIVSHLIGYAIGAIIIAKFFQKLLEIQRKYLGNFFNTLFKMIWYPVVIGAVLGVLMSGGFGSYVFTVVLISVAASLVGGYIFAKFVVGKIGQYYPS